MAPPTATDPAASATVLVVEDVSIVAMLVAAAVQTSGYQVAGLARTGDEAVALATELRPDIILMDIDLGGGTDGIAAAGAIRHATGTPVVFLTSHADESTLRRARAAEPHGYLVKPLEPRQLRPTLEMALHRHALDLERARLTQRLQEALEEVEQLRGLLPACAWCRRIKDDEGYWHTLEAYLSEHLNTRYTHGICDECARKMTV